MAAYGDGIDINMVAGATLGSAQFKGVVLSTTRERGVVLPNTTAVYGTFIGVLQNKPAAVGDAAKVRVLGESKFLAKNTTMAYGERVYCSTDGFATILTTDTEWPVGWVVAGSSGSTGRALTVLLNPQQSST
jgi:hypothetical protein